MFKWFFETHMKPLILPEIHKAVAEELVIAKKGLLADMDKLMQKYHGNRP